MNRILRVSIPLWIAFLVGAAMVGAHFIPREPFVTFNSDLTEFFNIIAVFAFILGGGNLMRVHLNKIYTRDPERFDILVTDMTMPGMTGLDLASAALRIRSDLPVVLCTGYSDRVTGDAARSEGVSAFLMKPLVVSRLAAEIRGALDRQPAQPPPGTG